MTPTVEPYRMIEPRAFSATELEAFSPVQPERLTWFEQFEGAYADDYEPKFPSPLELAAVCVLMPCVGLVRCFRWLWVATRDRGPLGVVVAVVGGTALGALAVVVSQMCVRR